MPELLYNKGLVFAAACVGMLLFGMVMISMGSILPEVTNKFQLDENQVGFLVTLLPGGILIGSLFFGPLVDWLSYKRILIAGTLTTLLGLEGIVLADNLSLLHPAVFCIGLGGGILNGITNALVSEISETDRSANLSLLGVFFGIGALGTPILLGALKGFYSFETIYSVLGICIIIPVIYFFVIRFPKSAEIKGLPIKEGIKMAKDPLLLLFGFVLFFQSGMEGLLNNWTTTYLENFRDIEASTALFILSSFVGALTVARIVLGKLLRIYSPFKVLVASFCIVLIGCLIILLGRTQTMIISGFVVFGVGMAAGFPVVLGYIGKIYTHLSGTAFSLVITIALIGNVLSNFMMGQIAQTYSVQILPYFILISVLVALVLLYITKKNYQEKLEI